MKKDKVFLDSDVILDLLTEREPHFQGALDLFLMIQEKKILAYTSPVVIANIFYIPTWRSQNQKDPGGKPF